MDLFRTVRPERGPAKVDVREAVETPVEVATVRVDNRRAIRERGVDEDEGIEPPAAAVSVFVKAPTFRSLLSELRGCQAVAVRTEVAARRRSIEKPDSSRKGQAVICRSSSAQETAAKTITARTEPGTAVDHQMQSLTSSPGLARSSDFVTKSALLV